MTGDRRGQTAQMAFTDRANPNRPTGSAGERRPETRGEARPFPDRCDPRHSRRPLTDEQRELVTRYMPMARAMARQLKGPLLHQEEGEAEAYAALVDSARTFDPDRGVDFSVHARPRISGALSDYRRFLFHPSWKGGRGQSPVFERLGPPDDLDARVVGKESDETFGRDFEVAEEVASIIRVLPRSQADACRLLYVEGKSCTEAAEALGCSKGYLSRLHSEALERLRYHHRGALAG